MGRVYKGICGRKVKKRMEKMRIAARAAKASSESSRGLGSAEAGAANAGDDFFQRKRCKWNRGNHMILNKILFSYAFCTRSLHLGKSVRLIINSLVKTCK